MRILQAEIPQIARLNCGWVARRSGRVNDVSQMEWNRETHASEILLIILVATTDKVRVQSMPIICFLHWLSICVLLIGFAYMNADCHSLRGRYRDLAGDATLVITSDAISLSPRTSEEGTGRQMMVNALTLTTRSGRA